MGIEGAQEAKHPPLPVNLVVYDAKDKVIDLPDGFDAPLVWVVTQGSVTASQQINCLTTGNYVVENDKPWIEEMLLQSGLKPFVKQISNVRL